MTNSSYRLPIEPMAYHVRMVEHLQTHEADLWNWFAGDKLRADRNESARLELLKSTYRIDRHPSPAPAEPAPPAAPEPAPAPPAEAAGAAATEDLAPANTADAPAVVPAAQSQPPPAPPADKPAGQAATKLYALADAVAAKLGIEAPATFYQSHDAGGRLNVALVYMPGEVHIVLVGPVTQMLTDDELTCVLAHEMLHFGLLDGWSDYLTASGVLAAMTNDADATISHAASERLFQLYTEVYCDRGALAAGGNLRAAITALVKLETGVTDISAESYLRQTDEIFAKGHPVTEGVTHPEAFIRARAIQLWSERPEDAGARAEADSELAKIIEGPLSLESLDLLGQVKVARLTERLVGQALRPAWLRTEPMLAHARLFSEDFGPADGPDAALKDDLAAADEKLADYYAYVLLDFAAADRDLEEAPLAAMLLASDELGLGERFRRIAVKELHLRKKQFEALEAQAGRIVEKAAADGLDDGGDL